jgi:hypothetical protein
MFFVTSFFPATLQLLVGSWTSGFFGGNEVGREREITMMRYQTTIAAIQIEICLIQKPFRN